MSVHDSKGKPIVAILMNEQSKLSWTDRVHLLSDRLIDELAGEFDLRYNPKLDPVVASEFLGEADACIVGWGSPPFTDEMIRSAPRLRFIGYAGGSVKSYICDEIVARDITVCAADIVNAEDVAQTTLGIILSGIRGLFPRYLESRGEESYRRFPTRGISGKCVGVAGAGLIGRKVISMIRGFEISLVLYDPCVTKEEAAELGCRKVSLEELAAQSDVVTVHVPSLPETKLLFGEAFFAAMRDEAIFINTALGDLIDQSALARRLAGSRIFAYLDILDPAQPDLLTPLPNVAVSPAIAGCIRDTQYRMGRFVVDELRRFLSGKPVVNRFDFSKLAIRA